MTKNRTLVMTLPMGNFVEIYLVCNGWIPPKFHKCTPQHPGEGRYPWFFFTNKRSNIGQKSTVFWL